MIAAAPLELLRDLAGPGVVFLLLAFWLVRKAVKAARTERQLEWERDLPPEPQSQRPQLVALPRPSALGLADLSHARADHVQAVSRELEGRAAEVLWVRSLGDHAAWLEKLPAGETALHVIKLAAARVEARWTFR